MTDDDVMGVSSGIGVAPSDLRSAVPSLHEEDVRVPFVGKDRAGITAVAGRRRRFDREKTDGDYCAFLRGRTCSHRHALSGLPSCA